MANIPYTKAYTPNINKQINKQTDPPNGTKQLKQEELPKHLTKSLDTFYAS